MQAILRLVIVAVVLGLMLPFSTLAQDKAIITITMIGMDEISISLNRTDWVIGSVASNTEYVTSPPIQWCTLTVRGNRNVKIFIVGQDAEWVDNPGEYKWVLSNDGSNGEHVYGLWFRISGDTQRGYVPITKTPGEFWPYAGGASLAPGATKQFGLKLLTPTYFASGRLMRTKITISAVAA